MTNITQSFIQKIIPYCGSTQTYRLSGRAQKIVLDWSQIEKKTQQNSDKLLPVQGGLLPYSKWYGTIMPSFAYSGKEQNCIVIYPGNPQRRLFFATGVWKRSDQIETQEFMAKIIAHESRHITQGIRGYGIKSLIVFPGIFGGQLAFPILLLLALFNLINWWWPLGVLLIYIGATTIYYYDWREQDARQYAREHWEEWLPFITVTSKNS